MPVSHTRVPEARDRQGIASRRRRCRTQGGPRLARFVQDLDGIQILDEKPAGPRGAASSEPRTTIQTWDADCGLPRASLHDLLRNLTVCCGRVRRHTPCTTNTQMAQPARRLLFVDNEETILFAVQDYFVPQGYEVDVAMDVENARALLTDRAYYGVVIDLSLGPGKETLGLELVRRVRERHHDTAVILFTAYSTPEVEREVRGRGAVLLEKPLPLPAIEMAIDRFWRSSTPTTTGVCSATNADASRNHNT